MLPRRAFAPHACSCCSLQSSLTGQYHMQRWRARRSRAASRCGTAPGRRRCAAGMLPGRAGALVWPANRQLSCAANAGCEAQLGAMSCPENASLSIQGLRVPPLQQQQPPHPLYPPPLRAVLGPPRRGLVRTPMDLGLREMEQNISLLVCRQPKGDPWERSGSSGSGIFAMPNFTGHSQPACSGCPLLQRCPRFIQHA